MFSYFDVRSFLTSFFFEKRVYCRLPLFHLVIGVQWMDSLVLFFDCLNPFQEFSLGPFGFSGTKSRRQGAIDPTGYRAGKLGYGTEEDE